MCENIKLTVNWEYVNIYLIIDLLRIIPYTKQREIYKFILEAILKLTKRLEKGDFYEYVNNTMRCQSSRYPNLRPKWMLTHPDGELMLEKVINSIDINGL